MAKTKSCCSTKGVIGHLMILLGIYLVSAGISGSYALLQTLKGPLFWGFFLVIVALMYPLRR
jgi:hypothetical protein